MRKTKMGVGTICVRTEGIWGSGEKIALLLICKYMQRAKVETTHTNKYIDSCEDRSA